MKYKPQAYTSNARSTSKESQGGRAHPHHGTLEPAGIGLMDMDALRHSQ